MNAESLRLLRERAAATRLTNVSCVCSLIEDYTGTVDVAFALHACGSATDLALLQAQRAQAVFVVSPCCIGKLKYSIAKADAVGSGSTSTSAEAADISAAGRLKAEANEQAAVRVGVAQPLHPRSSFMRERMGGSDFALLVQFADFADGSSSGRAAADGLQEQEECAGATDENCKQPAVLMMSSSSACDLVRTSRLCKVHVELDRIMAARDAGYWAQMMCLISPLAAAPNKLDLLVGAPAQHAVTSHLQFLLSS
jgi:hypothetical protein